MRICYRDAGVLQTKRAYPANKGYITQTQNISSVKIPAETVIAIVLNFLLQYQKIMKKDIIVQFVCFVTNLKLNEFTSRWEGYAQKLKGKNTESFLQQHSGETKNKFKYISQHEWNDADFDFAFMNERKSDHFPDNNVRVIQAGGYVPLQIQRKRNKENGDIKIIAFVGHDEREINFYSELNALYTSLNIYQAYYESCLYSYVMEFFVKESNAEELLNQLKQRPGVETGVYKDSLVAV